MTVRSDAPHPPVGSATPCAAAYARFTAVFPGLRIQLADPRHGDGWVPVDRLIADPAVRARLIADEARRGRHRYGEALRPDVAAGFWLHHYAWPLCLLFTLPWFLEDRVPRLPVERVSVRRTGAVGLGELSARPDGFACLPGDPLAGRPGARVVADRAALDHELRTALAEHLGPVLAAFRPDLRRGPRTLWGLATDELTEGLWYAGGLLGEERRAVEALTALLPGGTPPFTGGADFRPRRTPTARTRVSCCLHYTVRPAETCFGCPRTCAAR
ncbi:(2Fe-2S)-binding protein [Kitasatospora mediocidica]|uniref:(2Fe-2S)-binding protein n=1 Tax=Kitasatospora mediocidica TaxID=58352 RepID=UPI000567FE31|nr:(2Fe-2S)-binding protein [Kitasatospora mediocidica]